MRRTGRVAAISPVAGEGVFSASSDALAGAASSSLCASSVLSVATGVDEAGAGSSALVALSESVGRLGGGGTATPLWPTVDEAGVPWSASAWLGGMLGGMVTGAVVAFGTTTGAMTSVRASDAGTSGGGGGAG